MVIADSPKVGSSYYGNWPGANKTWRFVNCFQQTAHDEEHWNNVYCTSILIYLVWATVNLIILSFLLYIWIR